MENKNPNEKFGQKADGSPLVPYDHPSRDYPRKLINAAGEKVLVRNAAEEAMKTGDGYCRKRPTILEQAVAAEEAPAIPRRGPGRPPKAKTETEPTE